MPAAKLESIALNGDSDIQGSCDDRFAPVKEAFAANLHRISIDACRSAMRRTGGYGARTNSIAVAFY